MTRIQITCLFAVIIGFAGCGTTSKDAAKREVQGAVTFDGSPISHGEIRFIAEPEGSMTMTSITNGKYHIPLQSGVPVGASRVEIVSMPDTEGIPEDQRLLQAQQDFIKIPPQYNTNSKLKAEIPPGKGPHLLDFSLTR